MDSIQTLKQQQKEESNRENLLGLGLAGAGAAIANKNLDKATGLERMYHGTKAENVPSILEQGLQSSKAGSGTSSQRVDLEGLIGEENVKGKTYLGNKYMTSADYALQEKIFGDGNLGKILKVNIPYQDLQKMNVVDNPELRGMSKKEYGRDMFQRQNSFFVNDEETLKRLGEQYDSSASTRFSQRLQSDPTYNSLKNDTTVIQGDIDPRYIKGSNAYQKYKVSDMLDYARNNKSRFAKGVGGVATGLGIGGLGMNQLFNQQEKVANTVLPSTLSRPGFLAHHDDNLTREYDAIGSQMLDDAYGAISQYESDYNSYWDKYKSSVGKPALLTGIAAGLVGSGGGALRKFKNKGEQLVNAAEIAIPAAALGATGGAIYGDGKFSRENAEMIADLKEQVSNHEGRLNDTKYHFRNNAPTLNDMIMMDLEKKEREKVANEIYTFLEKTAFVKKRRCGHHRRNGPDYLSNET